MALCAICHDDMDGKRTITTKCNHTFCTDCLLRNIAKAEHSKNNCPMCRHEYFDKIKFHEPKRAPRRYIDNELYQRISALANHDQRTLAAYRAHGSIPHRENKCCVCSKIFPILGACIVFIVYNL